MHRPHSLNHNLESALIRVPQLENFWRCHRRFLSLWFHIATDPWLLEDTMGYMIRVLIDLIVAHWLFNLKLLSASEDLMVPLVILIL